MFKIMTGVLVLRKILHQKKFKKYHHSFFVNGCQENPHTIMAANMINLNSDIPIENQYKMIKVAFAGKIKFIPYPKNVSVETLKQVEYLAEHFKISEEKAKEYLEFIDKKELSGIIKMYDEYYLKK